MWRRAGTPVRQVVAIGSRFALSSLFTLTNASRSPGAAPTASCAFANATPKFVPPTSPVDFISGPRITTPGKRTNGNTGSHEHARNCTSSVRPRSQGCVPPSPGGDFSQRHAGGLRQKGRRGPRIHLEHASRRPSARICPSARPLSTHARSAACVRESSEMTLRHRNGGTTHELSPEWMPPPRCVP